MSFGRFCCSKGPQKESKMIDKYLDLAGELKTKKTVDNEGSGDTNFSWCTLNRPPRAWENTEVNWNRNSKESMALSFKISWKTWQEWGQYIRMDPRKSSVRNFRNDTKGKMYMKKVREIQQPNSCDKENNYKESGRTE